MMPVIIKMGARSTERRELQNDFIQRELVAGNEEVKQPQRERVADFFLEYIDRGRQQRCFCLPGARWAFESFIESKFKRPTKFIGCERNFTVMEASLPYMPGRGRLFDQFETKAKKFIGYSSSMSNVAWSTASGLMDIRHEDFENKRQAKEWAARYKVWSCAWLDFQSQICDEVVTCCKRIEHHIDGRSRSKGVPVAITFMIGREPSEYGKWIKAFSRGQGALDDRVQFFRAMWGGNKHTEVDVADSWQYTSTGGAPIGVVAAVFREKKK